MPSLSRTGEGNGSPLHYSCLENPRDGSLVGCRLWGHTESDTTDVTSQQQHVTLIIPLSLGNQWLWFGVFVLVFVAYSFLKMFIGEDSCFIMC